ncbi:hypothetical protein ACFQH8_03320 [Halomicroarcula sp. GCM10025710]
MSTAVSHRPTSLSSALALLLSASVALLLAGSANQRLAVIGTAVGVAVVLAGARLPDVERAVPDEVTRRSTRVPLDRFGASEVTVVGAAIVSLSLLHGVLTLSGSVGWAQLGPGILGIVLLGLGLRPVREDLARRFVSAGLAALVVGVVLVGVFERADTGTLLVATAGAIVAWDVAENGISLGEQLGATPAPNRSSSSTPVPARGSAPCWSSGRRCSSRTGRRSSRSQSWSHSWPRPSCRWRRCIGEFLNFWKNGDCRS